MNEAEADMDTRIERISLMPYCHADWAWGYDRGWHERRYIRSFEIALDLMDEHPEFTWFIDTYTDQLRPVLEHRPDLLERMKPHVAAGRLGIAGGLYCNPHPDRAGREAYIRNAVYGRRLFRQLFPEADLCAVSHEDVVAGHAQLPQVLTGLGYTYYTSSRSLGGMLARGIPRQFRWKGLDGSSIVTEISHYGGLGPELIPADFRDNWEAARQPFVEWAEALRREGASPDVMCMQGAGDDSLPLRDRLDRPGPYVEFVEEWRRREEILMEFSTPARYARRLAARGDLPEVTGTLDPVGWSYWYAQNGRESLWRLRLQAECVLGQLERALVHFRPTRYPREEMESRWLRLLAVWSHATLWLWDADYEEMLDGVKAVRREAAERLAGLREDQALRAAAESEVAARGRPLVVYNPLPWDREEIVSLRYYFEEAAGRGAQLVDAEGGEVETQIVPDCYNRFADDRLREALVHAPVRVPASGHAVYGLRPSEEPHNRAPQFLPRPKEVRTSEVVATVERGRLERVDLCAVARQVCGPVDLCFDEIDEGAYYAVLNRRDSFGPDPEAEVEKWSLYHYGRPVARSYYRGRDWSLVEAGPVAWRLYSTGEVAGNQAEWEILFREGSSRVDCRVRVYVTRPVSGYFLASVGIPFQGTVVCDIPWGVEERRQAAEPLGMEITERRDFPAFWGLSWADVSDGRIGLALLTEEGQQGFRMHEGRLEHFLLKTIAPENLRGARWSNAHRTGLGRQDFRFALYLHGGDWRQAKVYREVEAWRQPLIAVQPLGVAARPGAAASPSRGLEVAPENVMLSGLYREGDITVLRIYENEGVAASARVALPAAAASAARVNLLGEERPGDVRLEDGGRTLRLEVRPWEIVTLHLR